MLASAKPGEFIALASFDRLARGREDLEAIMRYCDQKGLIVTIAAAGMYAAGPAMVLSAGGLRLTGAQQVLLSRIRENIFHFALQSEVFSREMAAYKNEHAVMKNVIEDGAPPFLVDMIQRLTQGRTKIAVARATIDTDRGEDTASTAEASLKRQFDSQDALHGHGTDVIKYE